MKFDFVIGNPPYQEISPGEKLADLPVYWHFMEAAFTIAGKVELITPARFLFNAGGTPKLWNQKMLNDSHFKVLRYEQKSDLVFPGIGIAGGVAISYWDLNKDFGKIDFFTSHKELSELASKVSSDHHFDSLGKEVSSQHTYKFTELMHIEHPNIEEQSLLSRGHKYDLVSNIFNKLQNIVFFDTKPDDSEEYIRIYGITNHIRKYMWIKKKYITKNNNLQKFKIMVVAANGSGQINTQIISKPVIGEPMVGYTQSFISIGAFDNKTEAKNCLKYIKSKFVRTMVSVLKITQNNKKSVWFFVPWQDFSNNSDIKWDCSMEEIDDQLYKKYKLTDNEINFIESNVKAME